MRILKCILLLSGLLFAPAFARAGAVPPPPANSPTASQQKSPRPATSPSRTSVQPAIYTAEIDSPVRLRQQAQRVEITPASHTALQNTNVQNTSVPHEHAHDHEQEQDHEPLSRSLGPARRGKPQRLELPGREDEGESSKATAAHPAITVGASLAVVLSLFFGVVWLTRRGKGTASSLLPSEVVECLGRMPLTGRQQLLVLRFGPKLVLVSNTADGSETLAEITDVNDVDRLAGMCRQLSKGSSTAAFRQVLEQLNTSSRRDLAQMEKDEAAWRLRALAQREGRNE